MTPGASIEDRPAPRSAPFSATVPHHTGAGDEDEEKTLVENETHYAEAVIDNGTFGTRTIRFETGRLAKQAAGSAVAYLDDDTMVMSATTASKRPQGPARLLPPHGGRRRAHVRRRQDPRQLLPRVQMGRCSAVVRGYD
ncbi:hypothetical protein GCM10018987_20850 [Streptomyces cremeus]